MLIQINENFKKWVLTKTKMYSIILMDIMRTMKG
jgi:hypothetical protein